MPNDGSPSRARLWWKTARDTEQADSGYKGEVSQRPRRLEAPNPRQPASSLPNRRPSLPQNGAPQPSPTAVPSSPGDADGDERMDESAASAGGGVPAHEVAAGSDAGFWGRTEAVAAAGPDQRDEGAPAGEGVPAHEVAAGSDAGFWGHTEAVAAAGPDQRDEGAPAGEGVPVERGLVPAFSSDARPPQSQDVVHLGPAGPNYKELLDDFLPRGIPAQRKVLNALLRQQQRQAIDASREGGL